MEPKKASKGEPDGMGPLPPRGPFRSPFIWILLLFTALFWVQQYWITRNTVQIPYSEFKKAVSEGRIKSVHIAGEHITGEFVPPPAPPEPETPQVPPSGAERFVPEAIRDFKARVPDRFSTVRLPEDEQLVPLLDKHGVVYEGELSTTWFSQIFSLLALILITFAIGSFFVRRMFAGGGPGASILSFGRSRARMAAEHEVKVTFDDVAGIDEAKAELREVVDFLKNPDRYTRLGAKIPKGILLTGAPGTGKTLLARAVAGEAAVPFFSLSGSEFVEMFVGVGAARVRDLFAQAHKAAPCIVFVDEIDSMGGKRGLNPIGGADEREQTLNQLLAEMDGFEPNSGVILLAATNRPDVLDPALRRPGRFDRTIMIDGPDINGREAILRVHVRKVKLAPEVNLRSLAGRTPGFVGADLANLVNEAALAAARRSREQVSNEDFETALDRITTGLERKGRVMNRREKELVAHHEAGHALVAASLPGADPVHKVSIIPRSIGALGFTQQQPTEDRYLLTRQELETRLAVLLGGRTAEEVVFGDVSTGAADDLARATQLARAMVMRFGMSEKLGPLSYEQERNPFLGLTQKGEYGEKAADLIDAEAQAIVAKARETAREILLRRKDRLLALSVRLLEKEHLEGPELEALLAASEPVPLVAAGKP
ncbi:MAG: ATP-dependent zinc metalloprotease FtsH [Bdellovibrionota bacterium]